MKRILVYAVWIAINILPEWLALLLLDLIKPNWEEAARRAMKREHDRP